MTRARWIIGVFIALLAYSVCAQSAADKPDPAALVRAGRRSLERFQKESASWTTTNQTPTGMQFVVDVVTTPTMRRSVFSVEVQGRREELARIIQKDGVWYVREGLKAGKYRPFEAPLDAPTAYMYLTRSDPLFITEAGLASFGRYEGTRNGFATYRSPLPDAQRAQLANTIAEFDRFKKRNPDPVIKNETIRSMDSARNLLANGVSTEIAVESGMLTQFGAPERRTKVTGFRWRERIEPSEFATDGIRYDDHTGDPTSGDRNDLLMIGHCGAWRPGMKSPETDGRLLDIRTGRFRRIPFQGAMTLPGCFTRDRAEVIVTGVDTMNGIMGLYEIDLNTGTNRQLGGGLLAAGFTLFPSLSPDGKTVAVLHKGVSGQILQTQICLVDLASGNAKRLGDERDTGPVSWLPDGKGSC